MIPSRENFFGRIAFICAAAAVLGFFAWQINRFFTPPKIFIASPADGLMTREPAIALSGSLKESARLTINGQVLYVKPESREFHETISLLTGENVFVLKAEDRLGRIREVVRRVYRFNAEL
jgi:hypothetical protein